MEQQIVSLQLLKKIPYPYQGSHFISAQYAQVLNSGHCDIVVTDVLQGTDITGAPPLYTWACLPERGVTHTYCPVYKMHYY